VKQLVYHPVKYFNVIGSDITNSKEVFAFINKREGIIRFVNFQTGGTTPAPISVTSK
jgi:hypothetical protein